jgi:hypothetical protein
MHPAVSSSCSLERHPGRKSETRKFTPDTTQNLLTSVLILYSHVRAHHILHQIVLISNICWRLQITITHCDAAETRNYFNKMAPHHDFPQPHCYVVGLFALAPYSVDTSQTPLRGLSKIFRTDAVKIINLTTKLPMSTQLRATWHIDSLDMVVLPSTGASRCHNCCIDDGTSTEYYGNTLVQTEATYTDGSNILTTQCRVLPEKLTVP